MEADLNSRIRELEIGIKKLEAENKSLQERAEDTVALNVISELILTKSDVLGIINSAFEKISLLKKIPCIVLLKFNEESIEIVAEFYNHPEKDFKLKSVSINKVVQEEIYGGSGILLRHYSQADAEVHFQFDGRFTPSFVLFIHSGFLAEKEILVIFESGKERLKIKNHIPLFLQVKNFVKWRIENLRLLEKIEEQNKLLSKEVKSQSEKISALLNRYQLLVENSQDAIFLHKERIIQYANKKAAELLGFAESKELLGRDIFEFMPEEEQKRAIKRINRAMAKNGAEPFQEFKMIDRNGKTVPVEISGIPIKEEGETFMHVTIRDLRPRLAAEKALRESEERFRKAFITNPDSININRLEDGLYISVNEGFTNITGWKPEEVIGKTSAEINIWADLKDRQKLVDELKKKGYCKNLEADFVSKDGKILRGLMSASIIELDGVPHIISVTRNISSVKRAEEELRFRNKLLTSLFNSLDYPFYLVDVNKFEIILANKAAQKFSMGTGNLCYKFIWGLEEECDPDICSLVHIKESRQPYSTEINLKLGNKQKYFAIHGYPIFDNQNNLIQIIEYVQDVTEQKETAQKLAESELKYRRLFDDAVVGMVVTDGEGNILNVNEKVTELSGFAKKEIIGRNTEEFFSKKELEEKPILLEAILNGELRKIERELICKDGSVVPVEIIAKKISENEIQVFLLDLRDRRKAEEVLKKSEEQFKKIFTMSPVGILLVRQGKILFANNALCDLFAAKTQEELVGESVFSFIHPDYRDIAKKRMKYLIEHPGEAVQTMEEKIIDKKGNVKDVLIVGHNIELGGEQIIQGYMYDITERNKILNNLKEASERAMTADKLKSEFLAQVSHEIRTPLNVILNYTNLLKDELASLIEGTYDYVFQGINKNSKRIIRTIDMILNMSEISLGTYTPSMKNFDLHDDVIFGIYYEYKLTATDKGINFILERKIRDALIKKDHYSVNQIFLHLIDNAVKFTEEGEIKITIDRDDKKRIFVEIKDTGIGIPKTLIERIFEPFEQEFKGYTRKYEGAGLGLSIVKSYCELNDAEIKFDSEKNKGTTVRVTFN